MDKIKVGIPRALHYYYYGTLWKNFLEELGCEVVLSPRTNQAIMDAGIQVSNDEMCLSLKTYLGHVAYLEHKCDYILVPRIDNYGLDEQTCTNFLALYDIVHNLFETPIIEYNIDYSHGENELKAFTQLGAKLGISKTKSRLAYLSSLVKQNKWQKKQMIENTNKLNSNKIKLLMISHPYNIYDASIGLPIVSYLKGLNVELIYSDQFDRDTTSTLSHIFTHSLYWKYNKEAIGAIELVRKKIDGIIFFSSFPCGPDSLVNELVLRKLNLPHLNLIIDDIHSLTGIETRLESFVDILEQKKQNA